MKLLINVRSGLGNQLFQYAAGLYFAERYGAALEIVIRPEGRTSFGHPRPFLLSKFLISTPYRAPNFIEWKLFSERAASFRSCFGIEVHNPDYSIVWGFQAEIPHAARTKRLYVNGYFQAHQYAQLLEGRLRNELRLREAPSGRNYDSLNEILHCECAVSLHVRRGDYTKERGGVNALPMDYYKKAITAIRGSHTNPKFFVFSDDITFARESLPSSEPYVFIDHNDEESAVEDLRLMSACHHNIIANSTFSWWAAWLNPNPHKDVVVPDCWLDVGGEQTDLIPPTWRRVAGNL